MTLFFVSSAPARVRIESNTMVWCRETPLAPAKLAVGELQAIAVLSLALATRPTSTTSRRTHLTARLAAIIDRCQPTQAARRPGLNSNVY